MRSVKPFDVSPGDILQRLEAMAEAKRPVWRRWLGLAG
jgi:hypothetical protein